MMNEKYQIFGNGEDLIIVHKIDEKQTVIQEFKHPFIDEFKYSVYSPYEDCINTLGQKFLIPRHSETTFDIQGSCASIKHTLTNAPLDIDIFKNVSVAQLFKAINKKLNKRKVSKR